MKKSKSILFYRDNKEIKEIRKLGRYLLLVVHGGIVLGVSHLLL